MNSFKEVLELVDTFDANSDIFVPPSTEQRWSGKIRIVLDGWGFPVAVVGEFGTHWGDRLVVCELVPVNCHGKIDGADISVLVNRARRRLAIEICCFLEEMSSMQNPSRRGPFEVPIGRNGDGI